MNCKNCGKEIEEDEELCPDCADMPKKSGAAFWIMAVVLLIWELGVILWSASAQTTDVAALTMAVVGFVLTVILALAGRIAPREVNIGSCLTALVAFLAWYACTALGEMVVVRCGVRIYDEVNMALRTVNIATASPLWPWVLVIFLGLGKSERASLGAGLLVASAIVLLAVSAGGFALTRYGADAFYATTAATATLSTRWFLRLSMVALTVSYASGRTKGAPATLVFIVCPVCAGAVLALALEYAAPAAAFWAYSAVQAGFALVGLELAFMKKA